MLVSIYRKKINEKKKIFEYTDINNSVIKDKKILDYIASLPAIAPAYNDVIIFYDSTGKVPKILYQGLDAAGRLQQIYSPQWRKKADKEKFTALIEFGKTLPKMILQMQNTIKSPILSKNKLISIILRIVSLCGFRLGSLKYQKLYNSTGLITLKKKHLKFKKDILEIEFIGKKGMKNECIIKEKIIIDEIKKISDKKTNDNFLFTYVDSITKEEKVITAIEINNWLKSFNPDFTSKFFRSFHINERFIQILREVNPTKLTESQRKKKVNELLKELSCEINNTPAISKKSYLDPDLVKLFIEQPKKYQKDINDNNYNSNINYIKFLERTHL